MLMLTAHNIFFFYTDAWFFEIMKIGKNKVKRHVKGLKYRIFQLSTLLPFPPLSLNAYGLSSGSQGSKQEDLNPKLGCLTHNNWTVRRQNS